jgi:hypothetical protein
MDLTATQLMELRGAPDVLERELREGLDGSAKAARRVGEG